VIFQIHTVPRTSICGPGC